MIKNREHLRGDRGLTGERGAVGPAGAKGDKGDRGEKGETGIGVPGHDGVSVVKLFHGEDGVCEYVLDNPFKQDSLLAQIYEVETGKLLTSHYSLVITVDTICIHYKLPLVGVNSRKLVVLA